MMIRFSRIKTAVALSGLMLAVLALIATADESSRVAGKNPLKIYILAGQSNMLGQGNISPATTIGTLEYTVANDPEGNYQFLVDDKGEWVVRDDVWIRDQKSKHGGLTVGYGPRDFIVGPELGFGHRMGDLLEEQILIIKTAWGGKSLAVDFRPPSSGGETGHYYKEILRLVKETTGNLKGYFPDYDGRGFEIAGFAWHQGWNDRINPKFTAEYAVNMTNFIRDMRKALGVRGLPFVIATTGMDGRDIYTDLEHKQLSIPDKNVWPEFTGNVSVVDTRKPYEGLTFWEEEEWSPAAQGFHWNRNAKTYVNIGLAMADAMSIMTPGRCPFRLRAKGELKSVRLSWRNGTAIPDEVHIFRDENLIATAGAVSGVYVDKGVVPGVYDYKLAFKMAGRACNPLTIKFNGGITDLEWSQGLDGIVLRWQNNMVYEATKVTRNGKTVATVLGTAITYKDSSPPESGLLTYSVAPFKGDSAAATVKIDLDLRGELGILDLKANGGINPATRKRWKVGDQYRLAFVSSRKTAAESHDLSTYDAFLQDLAKSAGIGGTWKVIGSSATVDARDHTSTNPEKSGAGVAVFLLDGRTRVADNSIDLWNGSLDMPINMDEKGNTGLSGTVHTGTDLKGVKRHRPLGGSEELPPRVTNAEISAKDRWWMVKFNASATTELPIFAISDPLTVKSVKE
jgi:hypothetical protein